MKKLFLSTLLLSSLSLPLLLSTPAIAQWDFWNKPKATAPNMHTAMQRCLAEMRTAVPKAIKEWSFLQNDEYSTVKIQESYCQSYKNAKFSDMGYVKGELRYLTVDREYGMTETQTVFVVHGDDFPMLNNVPYRLLNS